MMNIEKIFAENLYRILQTDSAVNAAVDGNIHPIITKTAIDGDYIVYDNIEVQYEPTADEILPAKIFCRILCVSSEYTQVCEVAEVVLAAVNHAYVSRLSSAIYVERTRSDYDDKALKFFKEIYIKIEL